MIRAARMKLRAVTKQNGNGTRLMERVQMSIQATLDRTETVVYHMIHILSSIYRVACLSMFRLADFIYLHWI